MRTGATNYERVGVRGYKERGVVGQRGVGGAAIADVDGAKLRRAVGSNWLWNAVAGCLGDRTGDRLLGGVLRTIAHTIDRSLGHEESTSGEDGENGGSS
jgi:hypothetical protein